MAKIQKNIEIVRTEHGMRSIGRSSAEAMKAVLDLYYSQVNISVVDTLDDLKRLVAKKPDLVLTGVKFLSEAEVGVAGYLDANGINHTGSLQAAIILENHKPLAKARVAAHGIKTARSLVLQSSALSPLDISPLKFPLFVKPASSGGGKGIDDASIIHNYKDLASKITALKAERLGDILIEEYLPGREFSVAILKDITSGKLIAMPIELVAPVDEHGSPVLSQAVKTSNKEIILAVDDPYTRALVTSTAKKAFVAIGARDFGRIDIRMDASGVPHFLEANLIPSLTSGYGSFPKACVLNEDIDYENMILKIVKLAFEHPLAEPSDDSVLAGLLSTIPTVKVV